MDTRLHAWLCMPAYSHISVHISFRNSCLVVLNVIYSELGSYFSFISDASFSPPSTFLKLTNHPQSKDKMFKSKLLFLLLLVSGSVALSVTDPELKQCKHQCKVQRQFDEEEKRDCSRQCEIYYQEKQRRQREQGGGGGFPGDPSSEPQTQFRKCLEQCQHESEWPPRQKLCQMQCEEKLEEQERTEGTTSNEVGNPYVFEEQHFTTRIQTQHGRVRVLPKFTERSKLLKGIENYRLAILEAEPNTFIVPNHWDAEAVFFVAQGKGSISLVREDNRDSFNIRKGDLVRVPAGITTYLINRDNNEDLIVAKILQPVSTHGEFESFFGAGGKNSESFFHAFSDEILEAAFNTRRNKFHRIFGEQNQGLIVKASGEQIKALSQHKEGRIWPFEGAKGKVNIFEEGPTESNQYGQFYEVDFADYKKLEDLDIAISFANISEGGMSAPLYNSRVTKISLVINGEGYFEMACPHLFSQGRHGSQQQRGGGFGGCPRYQRVSARLKRGVVVVIPPGHPFVAVASNDQNLEIVCFDINVYRNEKFPLAGKRNVINQIEKEAKELAFGVPSTEVDEVFNSQQEEFFFKGPHQQQQAGRADT